MRFKHPVNSMEIFGYINAAIKERWLVQGLYENCVHLSRTSQSNKVSDIILFELAWNNIGAELNDVLEMLSIDNTKYTELRNNRYNGPDHKYNMAFLTRLNSMKFELLEKSAAAVNKHIYQHISEDTAKAAMSPAVVAAMLAAGEGTNDDDDGDDDDMLDRLEAFAADVDRQLTPVLSCEWIMS